LAYKITFKNSVWRDLKRMDRKQAERILDKAENDLSEKAGDYPELTGKFAGLRKYRVGDYRIVYTIADDTVLILRVRHRRDVYR